jgi:hypothetical protein
VSFQPREKKKPNPSEEQVVLLRRPLLALLDFQRRPGLGRTQRTLPVSLAQTSQVERVLAEKVHGGKIQRGVALAAFRHLEDARPEKKKKKKKKKITGGG